MMMVTRRALSRTQALNGGRQLHTVVGSLRLAAGVFTLVRAIGRM
jgi:hypothetical protein